MKNNGFLYPVIRIKFFPEDRSNIKKFSYLVNLSLNNNKYYVNVAKSLSKRQILVLSKQDIQDIQENIKRKRDIERSKQENARRKKLIIENITANER
tara:strand:- start:916 stop:1206 length:291 start_codon:yes stop_codon:yes gene_type:complete